MIRGKSSRSYCRIEESRTDLPGLPISEMSRDQKHLVEKVLGDLLLPFRKKDADEAMRMIRKNGSLDQLHFRSSRTWMWAVTVFGMFGNWKARTWSGISAVIRMYTFG